MVYESTLDRARLQDGRLDPYGGHYQINRCRQCALLYSSPILDRAQVESLYQGSAHANVVEGEETNVKRTMRHYYDMARPLLRRRGRALDIGCDVGLLLQVARDDGFEELRGLEPVPAAASVAARIPGAVISGEFYEQADFPSDHFDLITLVHVVDHLVDPIAILERVRGHLAPGGLALAVVHNSRSLLARLLGERFPPYNLYHHYFFDPATLKRLFERAGFEPMRVASTYNTYSVGFLAQRLPGMPKPFRQAAWRTLETVGLARLSVTLPLGNIGIVARRSY
jgi:2-polyprenyl-3-methyl-5-hydroxy-6-metoxy-1,4-benzoquinol methylase